MKKVLLLRLATFLFGMLLSIHLSAQNFVLSDSLLVEKDDSKLKYGLQGLLKSYEQAKVNLPKGAMPSNVTFSFSNDLYSIKQDSILIDAIAENEGSELVNDLKTANIKVVAFYGKLVTCWVAFDQLATFEKIKSCRWIQPTLKPIRNSGTVQTQGDAAQRSDLVRSLTGLNGAGVKIGVLSDSYNNISNGAAASVSTGNLPGTGNPNGLTTPVTVLQDYASGGTDEGRAMLEIVHDVAPNAQLYFHTSNSGKSGIATGITALSNAGCKVIVDDVLHPSEAMFQDDIVAQAVNNAKNNNGVTYFSSSGNSKNFSYENAFQEGGNADIGGSIEIMHNFGTPAQPITLLPITIPANNTVYFVFQWNQPFFSISGGSGATTDLNIYLLNSSGIISGNISNNIGLDAFATFSYQNSTTNTTFYLLVTKK